MVLEKCSVRRKYRREGQLATLLWLCHLASVSFLTYSLFAVGRSTSYYAEPCKKNTAEISYVALLKSSESYIFTV